MEVPFKDVFVLLLYLLPGFLSLQLYRAKYPAKKLSDIEIIIWSIVHTFFIHVVLAGLSIALSTPWLNFLGKASKEVGPGEVFALLAAGLLWGFLLIFWHWSRRKLPSPAHLVDDSLRSLRSLEQGGVYLNTRDVISVELVPGRTSQED